MTKLGTSNQQPVTRLGAGELRASRPSKEQVNRIKRRGIYIVCDNILDTYNIGSIFRLADAVSAKKIYLCGQTETPPNSRISKAAVGTDKWVEWKYHRTAAEAIQEIRKRHSRPDRESDPRRSIPSSPIEGEDDKGRNIKVIAIEQNPRAVDYRKVNYQLPETNNQPSSRAQAEGALVFVVGHETSGVSTEALDLCDQIVEIPMYGVNKSLNVMVSLAIVLYKVI